MPETTGGESIGIVASLVAALAASSLVVTRLTGLVNLKKDKATAVVNDQDGRQDRREYDKRLTDLEGSMNRMRMHLNEGQRENREAVQLLRAEMLQSHHEIFQKLDMLGQIQQNNALAVADIVGQLKAKGDIK